MHRASLPSRLLLLPVDLVRAVVLALRISLWHARIVVRSAIFGSPSLRSFCHPSRLKIGDVKANVCPFALKFANPGLVSWLCGYCHLSDRGSRKHIPFCRRRGGGPASSITHICFGVLPVLAVLAGVFWAMRPSADMLEDAHRYLADPEPNATPVDAFPESVSKVEPVPDAEEHDPMPDDLAEIPAESSLPPMPRPDRSAQNRLALPPPPLGFSPAERRLAAADPSSARVGPVAGAPETVAARLLRQARQSVMLGDYPKALELAERSAANGEISSAARVLIARLKLECGKTEEAREAAEEILAGEPEVAEAHAILGRIHLKQGEVDLAEKRYQQALQMDPQCDSARIGMARITVLRLGKD